MQKTPCNFDDDFNDDFDDVDDFIESSRTYAKDNDAVASYRI